MPGPGADRRGSKRVPVNLLVKVKYESLDQFIEHFATNIGKGGMFLQSRKPYPVGTVIDFEIKLKSGQRALRGRGEVVWVREPDVSSPPKPPGVGIKFLQLDPPSRKVLEKILRLKQKKRSPEKKTASAEVKPPAAERPPGRPAIERGGEEDFSIDISLDEHEPARGGLPTGGVESPVIGIDLGTTNSCAAVVIDGRPRVIPSRKGYLTIPSIVAYNDQGRLLVGHPAKAQMELNPVNTVYGSKRLVGRPYSSPAVQQMKDRFHYEIIPGPRNEAAVRIVGRDFSLQQVAALILAEIRDVARQFLRTEVNRAVITVPAYFNENQRRAVREAGTLAGLQVERIVNEPTAAALAFGYNRSLDQRVLVYDLGGGTFDVSVLELTENVYEVVATGGDNFLGGVDFDNQIVDYVLEQFCRSLGRVPRFDRAAVQRLRDAAEAAKCALSEKQQTIIRLPFFVTVDNAPKDLEVRLDRETLEQLCSRLVDRTFEVVDAVLRRAGMSPSHIDNVLLVGGQTRMPMIWRRIEQFFGRSPDKSVHPDEAVAIGAALLASSLDKIDSVVLIDVLPISIGIGLPGGKFLKVLQSGTALPMTKSYTLRTAVDNQTSLELIMYQGESERLVDNEYLGTLAVSGITPRPKGQITLEITFSVNQEGTLKATCRELETGNTLKTVMTTSDTDETIRKKLRIPDKEVSGEVTRIPAPASMELERSGEQVEGDGAGLLRKIFGRRKR